MKKRKGTRKKKERKKIIKIENMEDSFVKIKSWLKNQQKKTKKKNNKHDATKKNQKKKKTNQKTRDKLST